jgi:RNA polymerase sigma-70 factor (ECF subfamily)
MIHPASDSELVRRAKAGDHGAVTQIYERYATAIYRYVFYLVREADLAEDIRADVFVRMLEGMPRYEDRGWPLSAWLYRIARDRTFDILRRRKTQRNVSMEQCDDHYDGPEQVIGARLEREELHARLGDLTHEQRAVIVLRFLADLSVQEVARRLGRTEGAVKALQHRGLQSLARRMKPPAATG